MRSYLMNTSRIVFAADAPGSIKIRDLDHAIELGAGSVMKTAREVNIEILQRLYPLSWAALADEHGGADNVPDELLDASDAETWQDDEQDREDALISNPDKYPTFAHLAEMITQRRAIKEKAQRDLHAGLGIVGDAPANKGTDTLKGEESLRADKVAEKTTAPYDNVAHAAVAKVQYDKAITETLATLGKDFIPYKPTMDDIGQVRAAIAALGEEMKDIADKQERLNANTLAILIADFIEFKLNLPDSNIKMICVTRVPDAEGKIVSHCHYSGGIDQLKKDVREMLGYTDKFIKDRLAGTPLGGGRLASLDTIISPAAKAAMLVHSQYKGACVAWYTKQGILINNVVTVDGKPGTIDAKTDKFLPLGKGAWRAVAMPFNEQVPYIEGTSKTNKRQNDSTDVLPMLRKFIEAQFLNMMDDKKEIGPNGLIARVDDGKKDDAKKELMDKLDKATSAMKSEDVTEIIDALENWVTKPDLIQRLRKDNNLRQRLFAFSEKLEELFTPDGVMRTEKDLAKHRGAEA